MERPNTIWISRRKPPDVSPKARLRPVTMMMITATLLATGPSMLPRIDCNGAYHGIDEPPACAGVAVATITQAAVAESATRWPPRRGPSIRGRALGFGCREAGVMHRKPRAARRRSEDVQVR